MSKSDILSQMLFFDLCDEFEEEFEEHEWLCSLCRSHLLINDNYKVCSSCGSCYDHDFNRTLNYDSHFVKKSGYKQLNHFKHILSTLQNHERKTVPRDVLDRLEEHMEGLDVTLESIRATLKLMGETNYYKHAVQLWSHLRGVTELACLHPDENQRLEGLFQRVQSVYRALPDKKRRNFLNYNYLAAKLLVKIGRCDLAELCKPLKHTALRNHNKLWAKLCSLDPALI